MPDARFQPGLSGSQVQCLSNTIKPAGGIPGRIFGQERITLFLLSFFIILVVSVSVVLLLLNVSSCLICGGLPPGGDLNRPGSSRDTGTQFDLSKGSSSENAVSSL